MRNMEEGQAAALGRAAIAEARARERPKKTTIVFSRRACTAFEIAIVLLASALTGILLAEHVIHKSSHSSAAKVATGPTASPVVSTPKPVVTVTPFLMCSRAASIVAKMYPWSFVQS